MVARKGVEVVVVEATEIAEIEVAEVIEPTPVEPTPVAGRFGKIKWVKDLDLIDVFGNCPSVGTYGDRTYRITGSGDSWTTTVQVGDGDEQVIRANVNGHLAWRRAVDHNKGRIEVEAAEALVIQWLAAEAEYAEVAS